MKSLREKLESIVFAGLKPGAKAQAEAPAETGWGRLRQRMDKWVSGGPAPSDPLYLSNRSMADKVKSWSVVVVPVLILILGVGLSLSKFMDPPETRPAQQPTAAEVASKLLPNLKDISIPVNHDVDVAEVRIDKSNGVRMAGTLKNNTSREIAEADITCDLTDNAGGQLGGVSIHVEKIPASGTRDFDVPLQQTDAAFVLIRQITSR